MEHQKAQGTSNLADLMAKEFSMADVQKYAQSIGSAFAEGRHGVVAKVAADELTCGRQGEADPVYEVIAKPEGRPGKDTNNQDTAVGANVHCKVVQSTCSTKEITAKQLAKAERKAASALATAEEKTISAERH